MRLGTLHQRGPCTERHWVSTTGSSREKIAGVIVSPESAAIDLAFHCHGVLGCAFLRYDTCARPSELQCTPRAQSGSVDVVVPNMHVKLTVERRCRSIPVPLCGPAAGYVRRYVLNGERATASLHRSEGVKWGLVRAEGDFDEGPHRSH